MNFIECFSWLPNSDEEVIISKGSMTLKDTISLISVIFVRFGSLSNFTLQVLFLLPSRCEFEDWQTICEGNSLKTIHQTILGVARATNSQKRQIVQACQWVPCEDVTRLNFELGVGKHSQRPRLFWYLDSHYGKITNLLVGTDFGWMPKEEGLSMVLLLCYVTIHRVKKQGPRLLLLTLDIFVEQTIRRWIVVHSMHLMNIPVFAMPWLWTCASMWGGEHLKECKNKEKVKLDKWVQR